MDTLARAPALRERLARIEEARAVMREIRAEGIELRAFPSSGRIGWKPAGAMSVDLYRRLIAHKPTILLLLSMVERPIPPPGAAPGLHEPCEICGARQWRNPVCWQCSACKALWRPSPALAGAPSAMPVTARTSGTTEHREAIAAVGG